MHTGARCSAWTRCCGGMKCRRRRRPSRRRGASPCSARVALPPRRVRTSPPLPAQFLDTMLQRDAMQKAAFLRELPAMCAQFDARILHYKVGAVRWPQGLPAQPLLPTGGASCFQAAAAAGGLPPLLAGLQARRWIRRCCPPVLLTFTLASVSYPPPRLQVLPPLLAELRDATLQPTLLPIVLRIVQTQDPVEFGDTTLPALK